MKLLGKISIPIFILTVVILAAFVLVLRAQDTTMPVQTGTVSLTSANLQPQVSITNDLRLEVSGVSNATARLVIHVPRNVTNGVYDLFYTTNITPPSAWIWLSRCAPGQTNLVVTNLTEPARFFMLGLTNGLIVADRPNANFHPNINNPDPSLIVWNSGGTYYFGVTNGAADVFYDVFAKTNLMSPAGYWYGRITVGEQYRLVDPTKNAVFYDLGGPLDSDGDGLTDAYEKLVSHTDPNNPDSDYDGRSDGQEILLDGTDPLNPNSVAHVQLGYWPFDDTNTWAGDAGQLPLLATNVVGTPSWFTNAVLIDSTNTAILRYRDVEPTNYAPANINCRNGTVRFWFAPDWSSGAGPGSAGRLIEMGTQTTSNGWWALYFNTNGTQLVFGTQTNGLAMTNLTTSINWVSNYWHQIVLTYSPSNSSLYLDGQPVVTNGLKTTYYPNRSERANGFGIGSDANGNNQARGAFDELETFNYPLSAAQIVSNYIALVPSILTQPTNQTVIQGSNATFSVTAVSLFPLSYQWYFNATVLPDATNATLMLTDVQTNNAGSYYAVVSNAAGSVTSSNAVLAVLVDTDYDGLSDVQEYLYGTNPNVSDGFWIWIGEPGGSLTP